MELKSNKEEPGDARAAVEKILDMKKRGEKISALTAYDYPMARLLDEAGVDILLVGDSVGNVVLGFPDTTHVTMEHMLHHVAAVARAHPRGLLIADMPYRSYEEPEEAVRNARRLVEAGAQCLKIEGGRAVLPQVEAVLAAGIPVCGHLGMLPQQILLEGGYRIKGKAEAEQKVLLEDALALEKAGVMAIVLELVQKDFTPDHRSPEDTDHRDWLGRRLRWPGAGDSRPDRRFPLVYTAPCDAGASDRRRYTADGAGVDRQSETALTNEPASETIRLDEGCCV